jgi:hypothetical protein
MNKETMQKVYETAYDQAWIGKRGTSPWRIVEHENMLDDNSPIVKVYETDGNFYGCGWTDLYFYSKGANTKLKGVLGKMGIETRKRYPSGVSFGRFIRMTGGRGNGDHPMQVDAFEEVAKYINSFGYEVWVDERLT